MSDTRPASTPSSTVAPERMPGSGNKRSGGGSSSVVLALLGVACIVLLIAAFSLYSAKSTAEKAFKEAQESLTAAKTNEDNAKAEVRKIAADRDEARRVVIGLPAPLRGATNAETLSKIQKLFEDHMAMVGPGGGSTPPGGIAGPGGGGVRPIGNTPGSTGGTSIAEPNSPVALLDSVARQIAASKSINTKEPTNNDPNKLALHRSIQVVLTRIGAFSKPPTGNAQDTFDAIVAFQKANGLKPDGVIGKGTWGKVREKFEAMPR